MKIDTEIRHVTKAEANLFLEPGFEPAEAKRLQAGSRKHISDTRLLKQQLMDALSLWIAEHHLKRTEAAEILMVSGPRASDVVNRNSANFTIDSLLEMLGRIRKPVRGSSVNAIIGRRKASVRVGLFLFVIGAAALAQPLDVAGVVAQVKAMRNARDGAALLERAVHSCDAALAPSQDCADAYDWYGMVLQIDATPETLSRAEPLYRKALDLRGSSAQTPGAMALSLELDSVALKPVDAPRAELLWTQAQALRAESVKAIGALPPETVPNKPLIAVPPPMDKPGSGVSAPAVAFRVDPSYSEEARLIRHSGTVLLSVVVDSSGRATSIQVVRGLGFGLDEKAAEAVRKWVFRPGMKSGNPVNVPVRIEVNFRLL